MRAARPQWLHDTFDANLPRWGFVIFRVTYSEVSEQKWQGFRTIHQTTMITRLEEYWRRAANLSSTHRPILVSDPSLEGADLSALRRQFKTMRVQNEIPNRIATDCFLVVNEAVLNHPVISSGFRHQPKAPGEPDPWQYTLSLRAVDRDHDDLVPSSPEGDLSSFQEDITNPLPKVLTGCTIVSLLKVRIGRRDTRWSKEEPQN